MASQKRTTKKGSTPKQPSKRVPPISTDAALFTSTAFAFFLKANTQAFQESFVEVIRNAQIKGGGEEEIKKNAFEGMKPIFAKNLALACDDAANHLALVLFLEQLWKRLNPDDPKHIVAIYFCAIRLIKNQKGFKEFKKCLIGYYGKSWLWELTWDMALFHEVVKKRWDIELEASDQFAIDYWQEECEKFAYNYWSRKKEKFETIKSQKKRMIRSLYKKLGLA